MFSWKKGLGIYFILAMLSRKNWNRLRTEYPLNEMMEDHTIHMNLFVLSEINFSRWLLERLKYLSQYEGVATYFRSRDKFDL